MSSSTNASAIAQQLKPPPLEGINLSFLLPGRVCLFLEADVKGPVSQFVVENYAENDRQRLEPGIRDTLTWVAWNLPVGMVVTLFDNLTNDSNRRVGDLSSLGATIDLVGTGLPECTDLRKSNMNDMVSGFFWRNVDLDLGALEMFQDPRFGGVRQCLFLSEWDRDTTYNINDWFMNDSASSLRWTTLSDRASVTLFDDVGGGGQRYSNVMGWAQGKQIENCDAIDFNEKVSSFSWSAINPKKEIIDDIILPLQGGGQETNQAHMSQRNNTDLEQGFKAVLKKTITNSLTIGTTDTQNFGISSSIKSTVSAGVPGVADFSAEYSLSVSYNYEKSESTEKKKEESLEISVEQDLKAAPHGTTTASLLVTFSNVQAGTVQTTATRWYEKPVAGSVRDRENKNWYKRKETANISISGGVASSWKMGIDFQPHGKSGA